MARLRRGQSRELARLKPFIASILLVFCSGCSARAQLYERPVLVVDPDMHTATTKTVATDAAGQFLVTGSYDKTVRIWSASDGKLLRTIRMPEGPGNVGQVLAVAMSPDGGIVAAGGFGIQVQTRAESGSLGINLTQADGLIKVVTPIDDSPASRAGILSEDIINAIDGDNVQGLSLTQAVNKMRGAPDTSVTLKILRGPNKDPHDIKLTRAVLPITSSAIDLFDRNTGKMIGRITGLPKVVNLLTFSADGRYLAAVYTSGLRVFDRDNNWAEAFRDESYGGQSRGAAFALDGRLATSSYDGKVRLYDPTFKLVATQDALSGSRPTEVAFRPPDGEVLAIGHSDGLTVDLIDGRSLAVLPAPKLDGVANLKNLLGNEDLYRVVWSADGQTLFASGYYRPVLAWDGDGLARRRAFSARCAGSDNTTTGLAPLPDGRLFVAKSNPCLTMLITDGAVQWTHGPPGGDFRDQGTAFAVSADGAVVDFGFDQFGKSPLRFDVSALKLSAPAPGDGRTSPPKLDAPRIEDWQYSEHPKLDGKAIALESIERSISLAMRPDGQRFVLGADWHLYAFDANGKQLWKRTAPGAAWAVNISGDGRLAVAAYGDGTIRWHRMDDGQELLALYVLNDKTNWVAWTPEGFYDATAGAFGVLKWHVNQGNEAAGKAIPVSDIPGLKRPEVLPLVLQELETARAIGIAEIAAARNAVQAATGSAVAPGAQLQILTIGVSDYGDKATSLRLKFAARDANDVASALLNTQGGEYNRKHGLYADLHAQYLHDAEADRAGILRALAAMKTNMARGDGHDLAVVMFSGHGAIIDGRFYLLPYGVDVRTPADIEAAAISANDFHDKIADLARYGHVLVLLDACHSGAVAGDGSKLAADADTLRSVIADSNVTVLTSSTTNEISEEDEKWSHGAFTKVFLDALGKGGESQNGLISMSELTHYIATHVRGLTGGQQHPGVEQRFEGELFIAGQ
jgi:WD40 repeat protein